MSCHAAARRGGDHQVDDRDDLITGQLVEHDDVVDAVEELGAEVVLQPSLTFAFIRSYDVLCRPRWRNRGSRRG